MKSRLSLILFCGSLMISTNAVAQYVGFTYQAVAVDQSKSETLGIDSKGEILVNKRIALRFSIREASPEGPVQYQERHETTTDIFGIFRLVIGRGFDVTGQELQDLQWGIVPYFLQVEIDLGNGFEHLGYEELLGSPYALNQRKQTLSLTENELSISGGNAVILNDNDATNELITALTFSGTHLTVEEGGQLHTIDLSPLQQPAISEETVDAMVSNNGYLTAEQDGSATNELQTLSTDGTGGSISISGGNTIQLNVNDADADDTNEIQTLSKSGIEVTLSNGGGTISVADNDNDSENEIQDLQLTGSQLSITNNANATNINLSPYLGNNLTEQDVDNMVANNGYLTTETDGSLTNEIQDLYLNNHILSITGNATASGINLSTYRNIFERTNNTVSNQNSDYATDDFVFGSPQLANDGNAQHQNRLFFDKSKGAMRAGSVNGNEWNDINVGAFSAAFGFNNVASGTSSFSAGEGNLSSGSSAFTFGAGNTTTGFSSLTAGISNVASSHNTIALGFANQAIGQNSIAIGDNSIAYGDFSKVFAINSVATSYGETVLGMLSTNYVADPLGGINATDRLFTIGNGQYDFTTGPPYNFSRSDALVMLKNGNTRLYGLFTIDADNVNGAGEAYTLPGQDGAANQTLVTDGNGNVSWVNAAGTGAFNTEAGVTSNEPGNYATDDFVFGSPSLTDDGDVTHASRFFFDKSSSAFRAGYSSLLAWDESFFPWGNYSLGMGYDPIATGIASIALGYNSGATGNYAIAMGNQSIAGASSSVAMGTMNNVSGQESMSIGNNNVVTGTQSFAIGNTNQIPFGSQHAFVFGSNSAASASYSMALGHAASASGEESAAIGLQASASNLRSVALGYYSSATAPEGIAIGSQTSATGFRSTALGFANVSSGQDSRALGTGVSSLSYGETALGLWNTPYTFSQSGLLFNNDDRLFTIGNGQDANNRSDALVMLKNGNTTLHGQLTIDADNVNGAGEAYTLPGQDGAANQTLVTDGNGAVTWANADNSTTNEIQDLNLSGNTLTITNNAAASNIDLSPYQNVFETTNGVTSNENGDYANDDFVFGSPTTYYSVGHSNRFFFDKNKAAFRAGSSWNNSWDDTNVGQYSVAFGLNTRASGMHSVALGSGASATGADAFAFDGFAQNAHAIALGLSIASGERSVAIGYWANAAGDHSVALQGGEAFGDYSFAFGELARADGNHSLAFGAYSDAVLPESVAIGYLARAEGLGSFALGSNLTAYSVNEFVIGRNNTSYVPNSTSAYNGTDRLFVVGNGQFSAVPTDALVMLKNGNTRLHGQLTIDADNLNGPGLSYTLPGQRGLNGQVMMTDGSGNVTWTTPAAQLTETEVDGFVSNNGYLTTEVDGSVANEIQDLQLDATTHTLTVTNNAAATAIDLSPYENVFETIDGVTSNVNGDYANDDFVFGSPQMADDGNPNHDRRMFFDKSKGAFRAGTVVGVQWDDANVGQYSISLGRNTWATGEGSVSIGSSSRADGYQSIALGGGTSTGTRSVAIGGTVTQATGTAAVGIGEFTSALGAYSVAMGGGISSNGVTGYTSASGDGSIAIGRSASSVGVDAVALGVGSEASGANSVAIGYSLAFGQESFALGNSSVASGLRSVAIGSNLASLSFGEHVIGIHNNNDGYAPDANISSGTDRLFVIGNGTTNATSNALVMLKNGNTTLHGQLTIDADNVNGPGLSYTLPGQRGLNGQVMMTDGSGNVTWTTPAAQLTETEVDGFVSNNGYLTTEVDGSVANEIQDLQLDAATHTLTVTNNAAATAIDLSPYENVFETIDGVTSNVNGDYTNDDFVFGDDDTEWVFDGTSSANLARNIILFDKSNGSFRAGRAIGDNWNENNRGQYSVVLGRGTARGTYSVALSNGFAQSQSAIAIGTSAVYAENGVALGLGNNIPSNATSAFVAGYQSTASGLYSVALGNQLTASGEGSFAAGTASLASGPNSVSIGTLTESVGPYSFSAGYDTHSSGWASTSLGSNTAAGGGGALSFGTNSSAPGHGSMAGGNNTDAIGHNSFAMGDFAVADGGASAAFGSSRARSAYEFSIGSFNTSYNPTNTSNDRLFVVGNGTGFSNAERSDALVMLKNGNTRLHGQLTIDADNVTGAGESYTLPGQDGNANQVLSTDGNGNVSWSTIDADAANEIQDLSINTSTHALTITNNASPTIVSLSPYVNVFETTGNITSNLNGAYATDDFVFGSPQLNNDGDVSHNSRVLFDKSNGAFRAGMVTGDLWDEGNRGTNSAAFGENVVARGNYSFAVGLDNLAHAASTVAIGTNVSAEAYNSIAIGRNVITTGSHSMSLSFYSAARSFGETVMGLHATDVPALNTQNFDPADRLFTIGNGQAGSPSDALTILKNGNTRLYGELTIDADNTYGAGQSYTLPGQDGANGEFLVSDGGGNVQWTNSLPNLTVTGTFSNLSDIRFKRNVKPLRFSLEKLSSVNGYNYNWLNGKDSLAIQTGVIAQEIELMFPELVSTGVDGVKTVNYIGLIPHLIEALKSLKSENEVLRLEGQKAQSQNGDLQSRLESFEARLKAIEAGVSSSQPQTTSAKQD